MNNWALYFRTGKLENLSGKLDYKTDISVAAPTSLSYKHASDDRLKNFCARIIHQASRQNLDVIHLDSSLGILTFVPVEVSRNIYAFTPHNYHSLSYNVTR